MTAISLADDLKRLKGMVRKILDQVEPALDTHSAEQEADAPARQRGFERLFGNKISILSALGDLSELLLTLHKAESAMVTPPAPYANDEGRIFSAEDVALVEAFLSKLRNPPQA